MSIMCGVFPENGSPNKYQMEELFNHCVSAEQLTDAVRQRFGLVERSGDNYLEITVPLNTARRHFPAFYDSLPASAKAQFQLRFFNAGVEYLLEIFDNMDEGTGLSFAEQRELLTRMKGEVVNKLVGHFKEELLSRR